MKHTRLRLRAGNQKRQKMITEMFSPATNTQTTSRELSTEQLPANDITQRCPYTDFGTPAEVSLPKGKPTHINRLTRDESIELLVSGGRRKHTVFDPSIHRRLQTRVSKLRIQPRIRRYYARPDVDRNKRKLARMAEILHKRGEISDSMRIVCPKREWDDMYESNRDLYYTRRYGPAFAAPVCLFCNNKYFGDDPRAELYDGVVCEHCYHNGTPSFLDQYLHIVLLQERARRFPTK